MFLLPSICYFLSRIYYTIADKCRSSAVYMDDTESSWFWRLEIWYFGIFYVIVICPIIAYILFLCAYSWH